MKILVFFTLFFACVGVFSTSRSYKDAKIFKLEMGGNENEILKKYPEQLDFWTSLEIKGNLIKILVQSSVAEAFIKYLEDSYISYKIKYNFTEAGQQMFELPPRVNLTRIVELFGRKLDFWTPLRQEDKPIIFLVPENHIISFQQFLNEHNIEHKMSSRTSSFRLKPPIDMVNLLSVSKMRNFFLMTREDDSPLKIEIHDDNVVQELSKFLRNSIIPYSLQTEVHPSTTKFEVEPTPLLRDISEIFSKGIDFWTPLNDQGKLTKILVDFEDLPTFAKYLSNHNLEYTTVVKGDEGNLEFIFEPGMNLSELMMKFGGNLDFWTPLVREGKPVTVLVSPQISTHFTEYLKAHKIFFNRIDTYGQPKTSVGFNFFLKYLPNEMIKPIFEIILTQNDTKYTETESIHLVYDYNKENEISDILKSKGIWFSVEKWSSEFQVKTRINQKLQVKELGKIFQNKVSIWGPRYKDPKYIKVMVLPEVGKQFLQYLEKHRIVYKEIVSDVEELLQSRSTALELFSAQRKDTISFNRYERHDNMVDYLYDLAVKYPEAVTVETIGLSSESREIVVAKLSTLHPEIMNKPIILIDAGIHAREWIAPATALYIIQQLVENPQNRQFMNYVDWYIIPILNPDGYEYSHNKDRLWRKNRKKLTNSTCIGVDLNRNFGYNWAGPISDKCSESYPGSEPFSEKETAYFEQFVRQNSKRIKLYISLHSYGNMILYPWGYSDTPPSDVEELQRLGKKVADKMKEFNNKETPYKVGRISEILYKVNGDSVDWMKGEIGVNLSYAIEIYDGDSNGEFEPTPDEILLTSELLFAGMKAFYSHVEEKFVYGNAEILKVINSQKMESMVENEAFNLPHDDFNEQNVNTSADFDVWSSWFE